MTTTLEFYGHPFASFVWKPLIALYERDVTFMFRMIDPAHRAFAHGPISGVARRR